MHPILSSSQWYAQFMQLPTCNLNLGIWNLECPKLKIEATQFFKYQVLKTVNIYAEIWDLTPYNLLHDTSVSKKHVSTIREVDVANYLLLTFSLIKEAAGSSEALVSVY